MKLKDDVDSNYHYILVVARRARRLSSSAPPLVDTSASPARSRSEKLTREIPVHR
jgi:DNA-directed RNA polymerase subunit K/omega